MPHQKQVPALQQPIVPHLWVPAPEMDVATARAVKQAARAVRRSTIRSPLPPTRRPRGMPAWQRVSSARRPLLRRRVERDCGSMERRRGASRPRMRVQG